MKISKQYSVDNAASLFNSHPLNSDFTFLDATTRTLTLKPPTK